MDIQRKGNKYLTFDQRKKLRTLISEGKTNDALINHFEVSKSVIMREKSAMKRGIAIPEVDNQLRKKIQKSQYEEVETYLNEIIDTFRQNGAAVSGPQIQIFAEKRRQKS